MGPSVLRMWVKNFLQKPSMVRVRSWFASSTAQRFGDGPCAIAPNALEVGLHAAFVAFVVCDGGGACGLWTWCRVWNVVEVRGVQLCEGASQYGPCCWLSHHQACSVRTITVCQCVRCALPCCNANTIVVPTAGALKQAGVPFSLVPHPKPNVLRICSPDGCTVWLDTLVFKHSAIPQAIKVALSHSGATSAHDRSSEKEVAHTSRRSVRGSSQLRQALLARRRPTSVSGVGSSSKKATPDDDVRQ